MEEAGGNWDEVSKCIEGDEGKKLQLEAERKTKEVSKPKLLTVPTITFNNVSVHLDFFILFCFLIEKLLTKLYVFIHNFIFFFPLLLLSFYRNIMRIYNQKLLHVFHPLCANFLKINNLPNANKQVER